MYALTKEEGGRHKPFFSKYRPQFFFRTADITGHSHHQRAQQVSFCLGEVELPAKVEMVMPGDNVSATIKLVEEIAIEPGLRFAFREGGRTVGAGVVAKVG